VGTAFWITLFSNGVSRGDFGFLQGGIGTFELEEVPESERAMILKKLNLTETGVAKERQEAASVRSAIEKATHRDR